MQKLAKTNFKVQKYIKTCFTTFKKIETFFLAFFVEILIFAQNWAMFIRSAIQEKHSKNKDEII